MKIALVCTGLGNVWRGYERFTRDLFDLVKSDLNITLFKGGGKSEKSERIFPQLRHDAPILRFFKTKRDPYFYQLLSYAAFLVPHLAMRRYDLVHYSEPALGNILYHAKRRLGLKMKLLFSNGVGLPPELCTSATHIQELTDEYYNHALAYGIPESRMSRIPYGLHCSRFGKVQSKTELREKYNIPRQKQVILAVSAVNRTHKRVDYLIEEIAKLPPEFMLVVCGKIDDPSIVELAEQRIHGRFRFFELPFEEVPEVYNLADFFAHAALEEGFCLAIVEAMASGLPVIAHNAPHFKWLTGSDENLIDLSVPGTLSSKVLELIRKRPALEPLIAKGREGAKNRFDWSVLKGSYLNMYEKCSVMPQ